MSFSIDTCGLFARSIDDLQLLADVFRFPVAGQPEPVSLREAKVAMVKTPVWPIAGPVTIAAMDKAANILRAHCATVEEVDLLGQLNDADCVEAHA